MKWTNKQNLPDRTIRVIRGDRVDKRPVLEEVEESDEDFPKILQQMIENRGSSLPINLCQQLLSELHKTLARPLTIEDLDLAADVFVKHDLA